MGMPIGLFGPVHGIARPYIERMKKHRSHFEISEWPLVILTLFIAVMVNQLI
jgi:hypothetical protein